MDIDLLSKMVKELILDNDMVVLPGLGAFVAEMVPATFTDKGYTINPPYRRLYFRAKPDEGNELADFYAASNEVSRDVADRIIRDFVTELRTLLLIRKAVVFPGLGRLRATKENAVFFIADENLDIYPGGFGLAPVSLKTHQETNEEVRAVVSELKSMVDEPLPSVAPVQEPAPAQEQNPNVVEPLPVAEEAAQVEPVVELMPEPVEVPVVEAAAEPVVLQKKVTEEVPERKSGPWRTIVKILLWTVVGIIAFLALYVVFARMFPQALDSILYTQDELDILNRKF